MNTQRMWRILICAAAIVAFLAAASDFIKRHYPGDEGMPGSSAGKGARLTTGGPDIGAGRLPKGVAERVSDTGQMALLQKALKDGDEQAVRRIVGMLTGKDMEDALAILLETKPGWRMARVFLSTWADSNPEACARWVVANLPKGGDRSFITQYVLSRWVEKNVLEAAAWVQTLSPEQGRDSALNALFEAWAGLDPEAAAKELLLVKNFDTRNLAKGMIAYYWARKDIHAATAWAWNLPKDSGYNYALSNIARAIYETDKARGSDWVKSLPAGYTNNATLRRVAAFLTGEDSEQAASELAASIPGGPGVVPDLKMYISRWTAKDPEGAIAWAAQISDSRSKEQALCTIVQALALVNPSAAAKVAETIPPGTAKNGTVSKVASKWASTDPAKAAEWAKQLPQDGTSQSAQEAITSVTTPNVPSPASQQPSASELPKAVSIPEILNQDVSVAVGLAEQLPDGRERDALMHSIALRWAEDDPAAAAAWVIQEMPEGLELNATLKTVIWGWAEKDSASALAWTDQLADQARQMDIMATIAMALARKNPADAVSVVEQIPLGETRNNVVANIAFQWAHVDRNAVTTWAQNLSVEQGKEQALAAIQRALSN